MKRIPLIGLVLIATVCLAFGQKDRNVKVGPTADEESLKQLVQEWADAAVHADFRKLEKIQADNFAGVAEGIKFDRKMLHDALESGKMKIASWSIDSVQVSIKGNSAVVTGRSTLRNATYMGADFSGGWDWTDRFVKQKDGSWRAVSSQSKRIRQ